MVSLIFFSESKMMRDEELNCVISTIIFDRSKEDKHTVDRLCESSVLNIIKSSADLLKKENILIRLDGTFVVVGDIHGNVDDLIHIFEEEGYPPKRNYIFLGDYVDRGQFSLEVMVLLLAMKLRFPQNIFLLRGNHETQTCTRVYGFRDDCVYRLNKEIYKAFISAFKEMPVAAVVNKKVFCVHGGISPKISRADEIDDFVKEKHVEGEIADLLWSDPSNNVKNFASSERKQGHKFSHKALTKFLSDNNLSFLIRGHSFCANGYSFDFGVAGGCLTVFSCCDYSHRNNKAGIAIISEDNQIAAKTFVTSKDKDPTSKRISLPPWIFDNNVTKRSDDVGTVLFDSSPLPFNYHVSLVG